MQFRSRALCIIMMASPGVALSQETPEIWRAIIEQDSALMRRIGYGKLSVQERQELTALLAIAYAAGSSREALPSAPSRTPLRANPSAVTLEAWETRVHSDSGDVIRLENGAIVQVSSYVGYLGYRKRAVQFGAGSVCRIWIEGKRSYRCAQIQPPPSGTGTPATLDILSSVRSRGALLGLASGQLLEVDRLDQLYTSLWLAGGEVLILGASRLVNLSQGDQIISVRLVR